MSFFLYSSRFMSSQDILDRAADLKCAGVSIVHGVFKHAPLLHLCSSNSVLTAQPEKGSYISFEVSDHGPMPWHPMRVVEELFDCTLDRRVLVTSPSAHPEEQRNSIVDLMGEAHLSRPDQILQFACGRPHAIQPGTPLWQEAELAKDLVERNPELREDRNANLLLLLAQDTHDWQDAPFKFTIRKRYPAEAVLWGQVLLGWAEEHKAAAHKPEPKMQ